MKTADIILTFMQVELLNKMYESEKKIFLCGLLNTLHKLPCNSVDSYIRKGNTHYIIVYSPY